MASPRFAWGIDIGNRALKAIRLVRDGDRLRVDDLDVIEHEQILSTAGDNRESMIQTALANFVARHPVKGGVVGVGVSGQSSFARFIKLPPVEPKKIPEIVRFEAIQQIPFPLEEVEWSYQLFQAPDSPDVEVGIFAMRRDLVRAIIKNYTDMDMNVQVVQMNPLAVYNALYYDQRLDGTTMIVDIGSENTDLIIADGETVWLRNIPVGGNAFTEALSKQFKLNFIKAEELKRNAATSKYARQILQTLRPVFDDLVGEIQRSIGFYASVHRDSRIKKILALGNTFRLPQLQKYIQNKLQLDVARLDGFSGGAPPDGKQAALLNENLLSMSSAYGLAVQAMGDAKIESSLLPESIRRAKVWKEKTKWFALVASVFVVALGGKIGSYYFNQSQFDSPDAKQARDTVNDAAIKAVGLDKRYDEVEKLGASDHQKITNYSQMILYRDVWPKLMIDLYNAQTAPGSPTTDPAEIQSKQPDRTQRTEINLTGITTQYVPDLTPYLKLAGGEFSNLASGGDARRADSWSSNSANKGAATGAEQHGYIVIVFCNSPNAQNASFIYKTFVKYLEGITVEKARAERLPYYIGKVAIAKARQVHEDKDWMTRLSSKTVKALADAAAADAAANGLPPVFRPGADVDLSGTPAATQPSINAFLDPRFLPPLKPEDIRNDYEFTIVMAVVLLDPTTMPAVGSGPVTADVRH